MSKPKFIGVLKMRDYATHHPNPYVRCTMQMASDVAESAALIPATEAAEACQFLKVIQDDGQLHQITQVIKQYALKPKRTRFGLMARIPIKVKTGDQIRMAEHLGKLRLAFNFSYEAFTIHDGERFKETVHDDLQYVIIK